MARLFSAMTLTFLILVSILSVIAPSAQADESIMGEEVPSGLADCSIEQQLSTSLGYSRFSFHWNFTDSSSLLDEHVVRVEAGTTYTNATYVLLRGLNSDTNVTISPTVSYKWNSTSQAVEYPITQTSTKTFLYSDVVLPTEINPVIEYELVVFRSQWYPQLYPSSSNLSSQYWNEHSDTCQLTLDYETGDYDVDSTGIDFELSFEGESETMWLNYTSNSNEALRFTGTNMGLIETSSNAMFYGDLVRVPESLNPGSFNFISGYEDQYSTPIPYNQTISGMRYSQFQENSISYSTEGYIGELMVELLAIDEYGNTHSVNKSIVLDTHEPYFTTCDFQYNRNNHSIDIQWSIPTYITEYDPANYDVIIVGLQTIYETVAIDPTLESYSVSVELNETRQLIHDATIDVSFRIVEYQNPVDEYYVINNCARTMKTDLLLDPVPVFEEISMVENGFFIDLNWNVTHASDVDSWDFCWSIEFFLEMDSGMENCVGLEPEVLDSGNVYIEIEGASVLRANISAQVAIQSVCQEQCPDILYATLIPSDEYGQSQEYGVLSVISFNDSDDDGVIDVDDAFPGDANETHDDDGDGVGNNSDAFPNDANETHDDDGDGVGNNSDAFPNDANETHDDDDDGVGNNSDAFPNDANETVDSDGDGVGDNNDADPQDSSVRYTSDIEVDISDGSAAIITGAILIFAAVVFFVRRRPPTSKDDSAFVHHESMWNDDEESTS
jgi:hypothetical protein|tara:strand:- start:28 stop:2205 length:2178 start_codon:yes stop_codon:yes gene_type:complete